MGVGCMKLRDFWQVKTYKRWDHVRHVERLPFGIKDRSLVRTEILIKKESLIRLWSIGSIKVRKVLHEEYLCYIYHHFRNGQKSTVFLTIPMDCDLNKVTEELYRRSLKDMGIV